MNAPVVHISPQPASSGPTGMPTLNIVQCSRCQQSVYPSNQSGSGPVQFGMNSYYCNRCASKVGFQR
ncbi:hypothetical protein N7495_004967 [Penicillium taxi]|uniref:uncharacterized protein n=1 Tax=Penicillium taxi TaxID=168475 RepID=UPI0025454225|nr:uncharacterized protein N7495_004967 [Penicillium taxi]KAJ5893276.1 hypothetical protein N7495_004967 [Penicillium taxi]